MFPSQLPKPRPHQVLLRPTGGRCIPCLPPGSPSQRRSGLRTRPALQPEVWAQPAPPSTSGGTSQPHRHLSPDTGQKMCWEPGRQVTRPFCRCLRAWAPSDSPAAKSPREQTGRLRARIGVRGEKRLLSKTCKSGVHSSPEHPQYPVSAKHPLKPMLLLATESKRQPETCAVSNRPMSSMFPSEKANL